MWWRLEYPKKALWGTGTWILKHKLVEMEVAMSEGRNGIRKGSEEVWPYLKMGGINNYPSLRGVGRSGLLEMFPIPRNFVQAP